MSFPTVLFELSRPAAARGWRIEAYVRAAAGTLVLVSAALALAVDKWWILLTLFVGANLLQSALTGWCLMSNLLALAMPESARKNARQA